MVCKAVSVVPGLYKIFDEILVNAADNKVRDASMNELRVQVNPVNSYFQIVDVYRPMPLSGGESYRNLE